MKTILIGTLAIMLCSSAMAQEMGDKPLTSKITEVTVFASGAQITRHAEADLVQGETTLRFVKLSPYINAKTIQVKSSGSTTVQSVNHQLNYINRLEKSQELKGLEAKLEATAKLIRAENTNLAVVQEEVAFLQANRVITGTTQPTSVLALKEAAAYYGAQMKALRTKEMDINQTINQLNEQKKELEQQIGTIISRNNTQSGEILVTISSKAAGKVVFELSYMVSNAGWNPSYDVRVISIDQPVTLVYRANVFQNTKVDWSGVKLRLSSAEPNVSGVAPALHPNYLSFLEYRAEPVRRSRMAMSAPMANEAVALMAQDDNTYINASISDGSKDRTSIEFEIDKPYTVASDGKNYSVDMVQYSLPAKFQYYSVPKIDKSAFLLASIVDWEKYNLLEGEANIFFEGTFVGKTQLYPNQTTDTLQISLGRDRGISISRDKVKDFTNKKLLGTKKEESHSWKISVKNNKQLSISLLVLDQVPISTHQDIEVTLGRISGAKHNPESGEIRWMFDLEAGARKELEMSYTLKYPKNKTLNTNE